MSTIPSAGDRRAAGARARKVVPPDSHGDWTAPASRQDPVTVITAQDADRLPWLVPVRHGRMAESAFAFYRGGAAIMAGDLAHTPTMGTTVQLSGDAHLANFGTYASPERRQVFDVNDFDETISGPWEWDVKRMAASFVLAARSDGYRDDKEGRRIAEASARAYREAMAEFAASPTMDVWCAQASLKDVAATLPDHHDRKQLAKSAKKARRRTSDKALGKLTENFNGGLRIRNQPPLLVPLRDLAGHIDPDVVHSSIVDNFTSYAASLTNDQRHLLEQFSVVDSALKVVGVGSVGTRCHVVLLLGRNSGEPLFLQIKEAGASVLARHLQTDSVTPPARRVVEGQRLMQASSDSLLGWSESESDGHRSFYWRQFRDMKGSADTSLMDTAHLRRYAKLCGWTLAHAHARSGDALSIHSYLGNSADFDEAIGRFSVAYADQNDADYEAFTQAIADGKVAADQD